MKIVLKLLFLFVFLCFSLPSSAMERILSFDSLIKVDLDGSLLIKETIEVRHEGREIRKGIYRDLPLNNRIKYRVIDLKRNGNNEYYFTENISNTFRIITGTDKPLRHPGVSTYEITYKADNIRFYKSNSSYKFYWNITGGSWSFPIDKVTAKIILPEGIKVLQQNSFISSNGNRRQTGGYSEARGFYSLRGLRAGENFAVTLEFLDTESNIVNDTSEADEIYKQNDAPVSAKKDFFYAIITGFFAFLYMLVTWHLYGRDPLAKAVMPIYRSPKDLPASHVYFLVNNGSVSRDKLCQIHFMQLMINGFLNIEVSPYFADMVTLKKTGKPPANPEEEAYEKTFSETYTVNENGFDHRFHYYVESLLQKTTAKMEGYYKLNSDYIYIGYAVLAFFTAAFGNVAFNILPDPIMGFMIRGLFFALFGMFLKAVSTEKNTGILSFVMPFFVIISLCLCGFYHTVMAALIIYVLFVPYNKLILQPTEKGARFIEKADGIKMFLKTVRMESLERLQVKGLYPYVMALGMENKYIKECNLIPDVELHAFINMFCSQAFNTSFYKSFTNCYGDSSSAFKQKYRTTHDDYDYDSRSGNGHNNGGGGH